MIPSVTDTRRGGISVEMLLKIVLGLVILLLALEVIGRLFSIAMTFLRWGVILALLIVVVLYLRDRI